VGRVLAFISTLLLATVLAAGASAGPETFVNVLQAKNRFRVASGGYILQKNNGGTYPGHYVALDLGVPTISKKVKFGQFTLYLVVNRDSQADVDELLSDTHTGELGIPDQRGIHWEKGLTLDGQVYWLAKKRYGKNLVLWWYALGAQQTDRAFANLNAILLKKVAI
jgi:hypothetical protein